MQNFPRRPKHWNSWSPAGNTVWESLGGVNMWRKYVTPGWPLRVQSFSQWYFVFVLILSSSPFLLPFLPPPATYTHLQLRMWALSLPPRLPSSSMPPVLWWETDPWRRTGLEGLEKQLGSSYYFLPFQRTGIWLPTPRSGHSQSPGASVPGDPTLSSRHHRHPHRHS